MRARPRPALILSLMLVAVACSADGDSAGTTESSPTPSTDPAPAEVAFPDPDWEEVDPGSAGFDPDALDALVAEAAATGSHCLAVTRDGRLVGEWYFDGWGTDDTTHWFSATKSLAGTLIGIAQDDGLLDIDDPVSAYIPEWQGTPSESVTIRNLLSDDSGRFWSFQTDYRELPVAASSTAYAIGLDQEHPPGVHWEYNNAAIQVLEGVLEAAIGGDTSVWARERLLEPVGMQGLWHTDPSGDIQMFTGYEGSCRDGLRFGNLMLAGGTWAGEQIVSRQWVGAATEEPSQDLNAAYGLLWWRNDDEGWLTIGEGGHRVPAVDEVYWPGAPLDAFAALGNGGQAVVVHPSTGVVMSRLAPVRELGASTVPAELQSLLAAADQAGG